MQVTSTTSSSNTTSRPPPSLPHRPPTVDIQDFSEPDSIITIHSSLISDTVPDFGGGLPAPIPEDMVAPDQDAASAAAAAGKPRKLSRGSSIKSLFGGGNKPPKTTPMTLSPSATPKVHPSPSKSPKGVSPAASSASKQFLQVGNANSIFRLPKPQVKLLRKTSSVKQLYKSVLHALKTIASARDDISPELTKNFFENILRTSDDSPQLVVTKVTVKDERNSGRHFCSEVHAVEVTAAVDGGERHYHLVVKSQPQNEDARRFLQPGQTFEKEVAMYGQVFHDMANFVRKESVISLNCKDSEVIDVPRCYYTRWGGEDDNVKEDLIILENLYPQVRSFVSSYVIR